MNACEGHQHFICTLWGPGANTQVTAQTMRKGRTMANTVKASELIANSLRALSLENSLLTRTRSQAAIAVMDTSGSMQGSKMAEATAALGELARELKRTENGSGFELAVVEYGTHAGVTLDLRKAVDVEPEAINLTVGRHGGGTNITAGLEAAENLVTCALAREAKQLRPVVILLTDGQHNADGDPGVVAARLREHADIVCIAFGPDADERRLAGLASGPEFVTRAVKGPELRMFFAQIGTSMRRASQRGTSLARELGSRRREP